jgi:hypothetical protein
LPNNRAQAEQRMEFLKRKLHKDTDFHEQYKAFMNKLFDNESARVVPDEPNLKKGKVWYLPHHGVFTLKNANCEWYLIVQRVLEVHL